MTLAPAQTAPGGDGRCWRSFKRCTKKTCLPLRRSALRTGCDKCTSERVEQLQGPFLSLFWTWQLLVVPAEVVGCHQHHRARATAALAPCRGPARAGDRAQTCPRSPPAARGSAPAMRLAASGAGCVQSRVGPAPSVGIPALAFTHQSEKYLFLLMHPLLMQREEHPSCS